jgi:hypothetical protein
MSKYKVVPNKFKYKGSDDTDSNLNLNLYSGRKELVEFDKNSNINLLELANEEKNKTNKYRPTIKLNFIYNNSYTGTTDYPDYKNTLFYEYTDNLNISNKYGYLNSYEFDFFRPPINVDYNIYDSSLSYKYNWSYYFTYPYDEVDFDLEIDLFGKKLNWKAFDGIPFVSEYIKNSGKDYVRLKFGVKHNILEREYISFIKNGVEYIFKVHSLGNEKYNTEDYIINIEINNPLNFTIPNDYIGVIKRVIDPNNVSESKSSYYIRRHKIIKTVDDIICVKAGFEKNMFDSPHSIVFYENETRLGKRISNVSYNFTSIDDINIESIVDNKNRPISELYFTIVHKGTSGFFNNPQNSGLKQGWEFNINEKPNSWWDSSKSKVNIQTKSYPRGNFVFHYNDNYKLGDIINGDFCEWNIIEHKERVVSDYYNKITHNPEIFKISNQKNGYYYKPHNKITIKVFSNLLNTIDFDSKEDIPKYAFFSKKLNKYIWRDLYDTGFFDEEGNGVNHPFINDSIYPFNYFIFKLKPEGYSYLNITTGFTQNQKPIIDDCE